MSFLLAARYPFVWVCSDRVAAAAREGKCSPQLVEVILGMVATDPHKRILLTDALNLLSPSLELKGASFP